MKTLGDRVLGRGLSGDRVRTSSTFDEAFLPSRILLPACWLAASAASWTGIIDGLVPFVLTLTLPVLMRQPLREMARRVGGHWRQVLGGACVAFMVNFFVIGQLYQSVLVPFVGRTWNIVRTSSAQDELSAEVSESFVLAFAACVLGPMVEELVFRYGVLRFLLGVNVVVGHLVSATLFALMHVAVGLLAGDYFLLVPGLGYFGSGLCYGLCYTRSGNLGAPLLAHMLNNIASVAWIVLQAS